jgi:hypothetical protein
VPTVSIYLEPFHQNGGMVLTYHGSSVQAITPLATIQYYNDVVQVEDGNLAGR